MDNDVKSVSSFWQSLWQLCGTKLRFTSRYNLQSDPAERANCQVLEALRAAVATVVQYDEFDEANVSSKGYSAQALTFTDTGLTHAP